MLTTNDPAVWERAWAYKDHGKDFHSVYENIHKPGFRWLHHSFGTNWRMTEMQAAIGRLALRKVPAWVVKRRRNGALMSAFFNQIPGLRVTKPPPEIFHSYYKYYCFVCPEQLKEGVTRDQIMAAINAAGIPCFSGSCSEIYREQAFVRSRFNPLTRYPVARELGETSLMFLVHPTLTNVHIVRTCEVVARVMADAVRRIHDHPVAYVQVGSIG